MSSPSKGKGTEKVPAFKNIALRIQYLRVLLIGGSNNLVSKNRFVRFFSALEGSRAVLVELRGYSRAEVNLLMCAADCLLLTSKREGSPQVIKEAMACGCPIVSVDVGDVAERTAGIDGCFIAQTRDPQEIAGLLKKALQFKGKTQGRQRIIDEGLSNKQIAQSLLHLYNGSINDRK